MSWSHKWIGKREAVLKAVQEFQPSPSAREEFEKVRPLLVGIVEANSSNKVLLLEASGSHVTNGESVDASFQVNLTYWWGDICV